MTSATLSALKRIPGVSRDDKALFPWCGIITHCCCATAPWSENSGQRERVKPEDMKEGTYSAVLSVLTERITAAFSSFNDENADDATAIAEHSLDPQEAAID